MWQAQFCKMAELVELNVSSTVRHDLPLNWGDQSELLFNWGDQPEYDTVFVDLPSFDVKYSFKYYPNAVGNLYLYQSAVQDTNVALQEQLDELIRLVLFDDSKPHSKPHSQGDKELFTTLRQKQPANVKLKCYNTAYIPGDQADSWSVPAKDQNVISIIGTLHLTEYHEANTLTFKVYECRSYSHNTSDRASTKFCQAFRSYGKENPFKRTFWNETDVHLYHVYHEKEKAIKMGENGFYHNDYILGVNCTGVVAFPPSGVSYDDQLQIIRVITARMWNEHIKKAYPKDGFFEANVGSEKASFSYSLDESQDQYQAPIQSNAPYGTIWNDTWRRAVLESTGSEKITVFYKLQSSALAKSYFDKDNNTWLSWNFLHSPADNPNTAATSSGGSKNKYLTLLGRRRKVVMQGRKKMVNVKGSLVPLSEAKKLDKRKHK